MVPGKLQQKSFLTETVQSALKILAAATNTEKPDIDRSADRSRHPDAVIDDSAE